MRLCIPFLNFDSLSRRLGAIFIGSSTFRLVSNERIAEVQVDICQAHQKIGIGSMLGLLGEHLFELSVK